MKYSTGHPGVKEDQSGREKRKKRQVCTTKSTPVRKVERERESEGERGDCAEERGLNCVERKGRLTRQSEEDAGIV